MQVQKLKRICGKLLQVSPRQEINIHTLHLLLKKQAIPVIFLTASPDEETRQQGLEAGGVGYVVKPFQKHEIVEAVMEYLNLIRSHVKFLIL